ncbi:hypothetical protein D9611_002463 [Ephemerocybe angulata]|uniref:Bromo domain-containing protein n=1 Tax=Ephemerocybe angulata TaxID=980116 RepID=A0A8H5C299_9AGAR|nr:hypothetical protein D9611_002463 [Tulosesus angulatus]
MSARASRRAAQFDFSSLSNFECLLIAQAAHEHGAAPTSWSTVSKLMAKHPLVSRPKNFFTPTVGLASSSPDHLRLPIPQLCSSIYEHLLKEAGLEKTDAANAPKAPENLALAQRHFQVRFEELVTLIQAEETKFKTVMKEIEDIKSGQWDAGLKAKLEGTPAPSANSPDAVGDEGDEEASLEEVEAMAEDEAAKEPSEPVEEDAEAEEDQEHDLREDASGTHADEDEPKAEADKSDAEEDAEEEVQEIIEIEDSSEAHESEHEGPATPSKLPADEEQEEEHGESSDDEPLQTIRRSTRRKSSAASTAPPPPSSSRARTRRQRQIKEEEAESAESGAEEETDGEEPVDAGAASPSSPYEPIRTRDGKRKAAFSSDSPARDSKRPREHSELPGGAEDNEDTDNNENETPNQPEIPHTPRARPTRQAQGPRGAAAPSSSASAAAGGAGASDAQFPNKKFQNVIGLLHQQISTHRNGAIFHNPIKPSDAPDYYEIVKRPMDLKTMKARVKDGAISNSLEFQRDVYLMFANAMMYNRPGSDVYTMAEDMMLDSELAIKNHKQTEGFRAQRS